MAKIFWVVCPKCDRKFYANKDDFRFQNRRLMCPFCGERFLDNEAKDVIDSD